jgi:hypothetical protein
MAAALLAGICACKRSDESATRAPVATSEAKRVALRDDARLVLERHCGSCHIPESPSALPRALRVYNLRDEEWARQMSNDQLGQLGWRIREGALFDPFDERNAGKDPPPKPTEDEQRAVRDYVAAEIAARAEARD